MKITRLLIQIILFACCFSSHSLVAAKPEYDIVNNLGIKPPKYIFEDQNITYNVLLQMAESGDLSAQYTLACDYLEEANSRIPDSLNEPENRYYKYSRLFILS